AQRLAVVAALTLRLCLRHDGHEPTEDRSAPAGLVRLRRGPAHHQLSTQIEMIRRFARMGTTVQGHHDGRLEFLQREVASVGHVLMFELAPAEFKQAYI